MTSANPRGTIMSQRCWPTCTRPGPNGERCTQHFEHTGRCDWFADALKLAARERAS